MKSNELSSGQSGTSNEKKDYEVWIDTEVVKETDFNDSIIGTPYYLSPEIWKDKIYGKESDIWALGVILYELCCLRYPFPATEIHELEEKVCNRDFAKYPDKTNKDFVDFFTRMLSKIYTERPTIQEIIYDDVVQQAAKAHNIKLPLYLDKEQLLRLNKTGQLHINLTDE